MSRQQPYLLLRLALAAFCGVRNLAHGSSAFRAALETTRIEFIAENGGGPGERLPKKAAE